MNACPPSIIQLTKPTDQVFPPVNLQMSVNLVSVLPRTQKFSPLPANKAEPWRAKVGARLRKFTLLLSAIKRFCINSSDMFLEILAT